MIARASIRRMALASAWLMLACAAGCAPHEEPPLDNSFAMRFPNLGLFTPGSKVGALPKVDAGPDAQIDPNADSLAAIQGAMGDRCAGISGDPGTEATMTVEFGTLPLGEHWGPANVGAVWIEDAQENFVRTLEYWAGVRIASLYVWGARACHMTALEPDARTAATIEKHDTLHSSTWDSKDLRGKVVPDGMYTLHIEVTETETTFGPHEVIPFTKGTEPLTLMPPDSMAAKGLKVVYTPKP